MKYTVFLLALAIPQCIQAPRLKQSRYKLRTSEEVICIDFLHGNCEKECPLGRCHPKPLCQEFLNAGERAVRCQYGETCKRGDHWSGHKLSRVLKWLDSRERGKRDNRPLCNKFLFGKCEKSEEECEYSHVIGKLLSRALGCFGIKPSCAPAEFLSKKFTLCKSCLSLGDIACNNKEDGRIHGIAHLERLFKQCLEAGELDKLIGKLIVATREMGGVDYCSTYMTTWCKRGDRCDLSHDLSEETRRVVRCMRRCYKEGKQKRAAGAQAQPSGCPSNGMTCGTPQQPLGCPSNSMMYGAPQQPLGCPSNGTTRVVLVYAFGCRLNPPESLGSLDNGIGIDAPYRYLNGYKGASQPQPTNHSARVPLLPGYKACIANPGATNANISPWRIPPLTLPPESSSSVVPPNIPLPEYQPNTPKTGKVAVPASTKRPKRSKNSRCLGTPAIPSEQHSGRLA